MEKKDEKSCPSPQDRDNVRKLYDCGWTVEQIAKAMGMQKAEVEQILEIKNKNNNSSLFDKIYRKAFLPMILSILIVLIIPIPALVLDILIAVNLLFALTLFLVILFYKNPVNFSLFPTMLLLSIFFNQAVNIAAVKLILTKGAEFDGRLIRFIASLIIRSESTVSLVIGFIIFSIIIAIQNIVVVKIITRIGDVVARFILGFDDDSIASKQKANIEAEYNSGSITEEEAEYRKTEIQKKADYYGIMDGISRFLSGNVKVQLFIITFIIIAGTLIGVLLRGQTVKEALVTYIPFAVSSGILFALHTLLLALAMRAVSRMVYKERIYKSAEIIYDNSTQDIILLELGYGLIPLVEKEKGAELIKCIHEMRRKIADDIGIIVPKIRIIDNIILDPKEYRIMVREKEAGKGIINIDDTAVDHHFVIVAHLTEVIKLHTNELLEPQKTEGEKDESCDP